MLKSLVRWFLGKLYRIEVSGLENLQKVTGNVVIVANHTSFLDAVLLYAFFPDKLTFAVNTDIARQWYLRVLQLFFDLLPMDPGNALAIKHLIKCVKQGNKVVIFPEGRITVTGTLMKIYPGPGMVAERTGAMVLPVHIEGAQFTPFSRMKGKVRLRWFPKIKLTVLPPRKITTAAHAEGRERRRDAGKMLADIMTEMIFQCSTTAKPILDVLLDARNIYGGQHIIVEDVARKPISYNQLLTKIVVLSNLLKIVTQRGEHVGILLPNSVANVATFFALQRYGRIPAMLNFSIGAKGIVSACHTAAISHVISSRRFVEKAKLENTLTELSAKVNIIYLEDYGRSISLVDKIMGLFISRFDVLVRRPYNNVEADAAAVVLFTSGSEGTPKGVVLSHRNLLANRAQLGARVDFNASDIVLNALPMFHSFGLTAATILPLLSGMRTFLYPSPLHYRIIPEIAYSINATLLFGTNTFLSGYARFAHDYDFTSLRYVFAGAEKLKKEIRLSWESRFGVRVFEGYGATETSPVLAANTPMENHPGTVGQLLPGVKHKLLPVPGLTQGQRLLVKGPNVMLGYYLYDNPAQLVPPVDQQLGEGWYDTGDIVQMDEQGLISIVGRAKRFAKIAGEMVSLTAVESLAQQVWSEAQHAAVSLPDEQKGEAVVLLTSQVDAARAELLAAAKKNGIAELLVPRKIISVKQIPVLGTGKTDYVGVQALLDQAMGL